MGNVFTRIKDSISADIHQMLDKKEQKNPITALNQYLRESEKEKEKVRKIIERQYRLKDEFTKEYLKAQDFATKRKKQADIAEAAGESELFEFAIKEYKDYATRVEKMKKMRDDASEQLEVLEQKYAEMQYKLKDMHLRRMELMGRENIVRANSQMTQVINDISDKPFSRFEEIERYIETLEYKVNSDHYRNTFDHKIEQLEKNMRREKADN